MSPVTLERTTEKIQHGTTVLLKPSRATVYMSQACSHGRRIMLASAEYLESAVGHIVQPMLPYKILQYNQVSPVSG